MIINRPREPLLYLYLLYIVLNYLKISIYIVYKNIDLFN